MTTAAVASRFFSLKIDSGKTAISGKYSILNESPLQLSVNLQFFYKGPGRDTYQIGAMHTVREGVTHSVAFVFKASVISVRIFGGKDKEPLQIEAVSSGSSDSKEEKKG